MQNVLVQGVVIAFIAALPSAFSTYVFIGIAIDNLDKPGARAAFWGGIAAALATVGCSVTVLSLVYVGCVFFWVLRGPL